MFFNFLNISDFFCRGSLLASNGLKHLPVGKILVGTSCMGTYIVPVYDICRLQTKYC